MDVAEPAPLALPDALRAVHAAFECPDMAQFPNLMRVVAKQVAGVQRSTDKLTARPTPSEAANAAVAPLPVLTSDFAVQFEAFRREFGAVIAAHTRLLAALETATARAATLEQARTRLQTATHRAGEIVRDAAAR